jgi:hypothetical protein
LLIQRRLGGSAALLHASAISHLICITTASMLRLTTMSRLQRAAMPDRCFSVMPAILETGAHEFKSSRDPSMMYRVTFGRAGHLECTCEGFRWRGNCKHVRAVRGIS